MIVSLVLKSIKALKGFDHQKLHVTDSTLFFEFTKESKRGLLFYPITIITRFLLAFFIVFLPNPTARLTMMMIIQIAVRFLLLFSTSDLFFSLLLSGIDLGSLLT